MLNKSRQAICGDIQSGKTLASESLTAVAIDLGCPIVVVIAGTTDKLRDQTQRRFDQDLVDQNDSILSPTTDGDLTTNRPSNPDSRRIWGHLRRSVRLHLEQDKGNSLILVVKKNSSVLEATNDLLEYVKSRGLLREMPIMVIDDESDSFTQNNISDYYDGTANTVRGPVHKSIVRIVEGFDTIYWGVSATVAASIFLHPKDPLLTSAHVLEPHEFYLGLFEVFAKHVDRMVKAMRG